MKYLFTTLLTFLFCVTSAWAHELRFVAADSEQIRFTGRTLIAEDGSVAFDWSGTSFTFRFSGRRCAIRVTDTGRNYYNVFVDGVLRDTVSTSGAAPQTIMLADKLPRGEHLVRVQKRTEGEQGRTTVLEIGTDGTLLAAPAAPLRHIEFIGDSHTCGYGTEGLSAKEPFTPQTENCELAWGCILARYFGADYTLIAHSGQGIVRNWGDKKERSDSTMRERMLRTFDMVPAPRWDFGRIRPDVVVIKLGTNDFSTDISPSQEAYNAAYAQVIGQLREAYGPVPVVCVAPQGVSAIRAYLEAFVREQNDPHLFWAAMNDSVTNWDTDMGANFHPNHQGHRKMAMTIAPYIATITGWDLPTKTVE